MHTWNYGLQPCLDGASHFELCGGAQKVECAPPTDLVVDVDNNLQSGWIRLQITVRSCCSNYFSTPHLPAAI